MKRKYFNGKTGLITTIRISCTAAFCMLPTQSFAGSTEAPAAAAEPEAASNWVDLTVGGVFVSGDEGAFQRRTGTNGDFYGGISSMHWEKEANDITWTLDGHALFGNEDYEIILGAEKADLGYVEAGFRQFRSWYDGSGGYVPGNINGWFPIQDDELTLDRGELWFEAGLRMENLPEITFRYAHGWRDGEKDSTIWGRASGTSSNYSVVPSLNEIDESRDTFELDIAYTLGKTDLGLGMTYEMVNNQDSREMMDLNSNILTTQKDNYDSDLFNVHTSSATRFNDRMLLSFGYAFTTMDTDTDGSTRYQNVGTGRHDFTPITGGGELNMNVANANFWWNPVDDLVIVPSIRAEWTDQSAIAFGFDEPGEELGNVTDASDYEYDSLTEQLDLRYTGLENVLLYSNFIFSQADRDIDYQYVEYDTGEVPPVMEDGFRRKTTDIDQQKYVVGANWYPMSCLSFSTQYYHRHSELSSDNTLVGTDAHLGDLEFDTDDVSLRMTWRVLPNLTLVSRYDYQETTIDAKGISGANLVLPQIESGDITSQTFSQSITWMPFENGYIQGTVSYVKAETDTPADDQAPLRITDCDNDYLTANVIVGYSIDPKTEITASYSYYYANDYEVPYQAPGVPGSVGFGTDLQENVFSVSLNRLINRNMTWNLGYGYYTSNDGTSGGHNDFDAHMVSTGLQIRF